MGASSGISGLANMLDAAQDIVMVFETKGFMSVTIQDPIVRCFESQMKDNLWIPHGRSARQVHPRSGLSPLLSYCLYTKYVGVRHCTHCPYSQIILGFCTADTASTARISSVSTAHIASTRSTKYKVLLLNTRIFTV